MNILAVDTGFAQTKVYTGGNQVIFPTAVARPSNLDIVEVDDSKMSKQYTISEKTLVVGHDALKSSVTQDYNLEVADLIDNVPYLVAAAAALAGVDLAMVDILALGLPIGDFVKNKARLLKIMGAYNVNGITYSPRIIIVPQAVGVLQAYLRETAVKADDEEGVVLDCGGNTLHVLSYCGAEARREGSKQYLEKGVAVAAKTVSVLIKKKTGLELLLPEVMEIMRHGSLTLRGDRIDLSNEISKILVDHFSELVREIQTDFRKIFDRKDKLVLAGGGASLLKEHLPEIWQPMITIVADPEFANARGYFYIARGV
jgi:plasmid segregation protein ParM